MVDPAFVIIGFAALGSGFRLFWGVYKAWTSALGMKIEARRILFEFFMGMSFGCFGGILINELGIFKIGVSLAAMISGLLGSNVVDLIAKKFGWNKKMEVIVSDQQLEFVDLSPEDIRALQYVKEYGKIDNATYQKINGVTRDAAKHQLASLVARKKLKRVGNTKGCTYIAGKK
jgi:hypothetical protein